MYGQFVAFLEIVVQPVGDLATRYPFNGDGEAVGYRGRAGDGVGAHDRLPVDLQLQGDELAGLEEEQHRLFGHEAESAHIPGFLDGFDAAHQVATVAPGLSGNGIEEIVRHGRSLARSGLTLAYCGGLCATVSVLIYP
ncbi:hypothetical protein D3C80_1270990 [compost metagenome]